MATAGKTQIWIFRALFLVFVLGSWELASGRLTSEFFISRPTLIYDQFMTWLWQGTIFYHGAITLIEAVAGPSF